MLSKRYPDKHSEITMPIGGVNLRDPQHILKPGECSRLQNCLYDGGVIPIPGTRLLTPSTLGASKRIRGGHRFYRADGTKKRLVAYDTKISEINDAGSESILTSTMTSDAQVYFTTWPITDRVYASNGRDNLAWYDGSSFSTLTGTNIPTPKGPVVPVLDRLMCISSYGIERTDSRSDTVWSSNSSWATKRPVKPGLFTTIHPYSVRGADTIYPGLLAFQANAYYLVTGTAFGTDVTAASASVDEDSAIQLLDGNVGTSSPMSVCTVPGVGIFWVTSDLNVYFLPEGRLTGMFIGDKLQSRGAVKGLNDANLNYLDQIWMVYYDRKLLLGFPTGTNSYSDTQYWLDLRYLTADSNIGAVWYGPHTVNTWGVVWREDQGGDLGLYAGEGNTTTGAYVYKGYQTDIVGHTVGSSTTLPTAIYQDRNIPFEGGSNLKYAQDIRLSITTTGGTVKAGMVDLGDNVTYRQTASTWTD